MTVIYTCVCKCAEEKPKDDNKVACLKRLSVLCPHSPEKKKKKHQIHVICVKAENWICASSTWCVDGDMTTYYAITIYTSAIVSATLGVLGVNLLT